jgi:hypothetical protein
LDGKQASGSYAAAVHTHVVADVTGLQAILDGKQASGSYAAATHTHAIADTTGLQAALDSKQAAGTYATLVGGTVPAGQLPSYVDDILEFAALVNFPATGETGKIYVTTGTNRTYRWSGSTYIEISASPGSTDAVPEGSTNLYHTNVRAAAAAPVQSVAGRTGAIALAVADVSGAVSSSDSRLTDTRTPTDASVTTAKLASSLVVDGNSLTLRFRRDTLANFTSANPTAALGELLYETDTNRVKVGDGTTAYTTLAYLTTGGGGGGGASPPSTLLDALTFNGSTTTFTLRSGGTAVTPTAVGNVIVSLNGVIQQPGVSYTIAGSGITFSVAPATGDEFFGVLMGGNVPHKSTHATGGSDALTPSDIGAATQAYVDAIPCRAGSGEYTALVGGDGSGTATGEGGVVMGGIDCEVSGSYAIATGVGAKSDRWAMMAHSSSFYSTPGDAQRVSFVLRNGTTSSAVTRTLFLYSSSVSATSGTRLTIPSGKALFATVTIAGIINGGTKAAHYIRKVAIKNVGGTTSLIGTVSTVGTDVEDDAAYDVAITADNTNDALQINVTGKTGEAIRWVASVDGVEIAYG